MGRGGCEQLACDWGPAVTCAMRGRGDGDGTVPRGGGRWLSGHCWGLSVLLSRHQRAPGSAALPRAAPRAPGDGTAAMRINQNTVLQGKKVTLVPYTSAHVPRYHQWMQSEELQRLTASEPLSLEQEYEMQRSWRDDADKCTFIVLDAEQWSEQARGDEDCMVGDVNLFLTDTEDPTLGEIEIMIAEPSYRGRGFGKEATLMMMSYGVTDLGITKFEAKIGQENEASICMFKKLHFKEVSVNSVFQEVTLRLDVSDQEKQWLLDQTNHVKKRSYVEVKLPAGVLES